MKKILVIDTCKACSLSYDHDYNPFCHKLKRHLATEKYPRVGVPIMPDDCPLETYVNDEVWGKSLPIAQSLYNKISNKTILVDKLFNESEENINNALKHLKGKDK